MPAHLELLDVPYTGSQPAAMALCCDKAAVRLVAQSLGIAVPRETFVEASAPLDALPEIYPALIKPNRADDEQLFRAGDVLEVLHSPRIALDNRHCRSFHVAGSEGNGSASRTTRSATKARSKQA